MENFYLCNSAALQANLSKSAFKIYAFLSKSANNKTRSCFYKRSSIAKFCHISESTVVRAIRELCIKGLLEIKRRFDQGRQISNLYILLDNPQLKMDSTASNESKKGDIPVICNGDSKQAQNGSQSKIRLFRCNSIGFQVKLAPNTTKVYAYLSFRAGKDRQCMPSKRDIASGCGISLPTVTRAIRQLRDTGLISVVPQTRKPVYGNNGTSVNLYILKNEVDITPTKGIAPHINRSPVWKVLLCLFFARLTPSPMSPVTPHRTMSRKKFTLKQRKEYFFSKLTKRYKAHNYSKLLESRNIPKKRIDFNDTG